jgi:hypothetical protein
MVRIDGVDEHWWLEWQRPPEPACFDDLGCYCREFSFGEKGELDLVRQRAGEPEDRLHLTPLMGEEIYDSPGRFHKGKAILVRWPATGPDFEHVPSLTDLGARRSASVMQFADYDHDGRATEFKVLIWNFAPCAEGRLAIIVGIDRKNTKLHAFSAAGSPATPMTLTSESWEEVRSHVPTTVVESGCGNHGSTTEYSSSVWVDGHGLHIVNRQRNCDP